MKKGLCGIGSGIDVVESVVCEHGAGQRDFADDVARDDAIIMHFQRSTHFGLASYAALVTTARRIGLTGDADKL